MPLRKRYRCRFCGASLPAWLPVAKRPEGSMLLYHLGQQHPNQVGHVSRGCAPRASRSRRPRFEGVTLEDDDGEPRGNGVQKAGGAGLNGRSPLCPRAPVTHRPMRGEGPIPQGGCPTLHWV